MSFRLAVVSKVELWNFRNSSISVEVAEGQEVGLITCGRGETSLFGNLVVQIVRTATCLSTSPVPPCLVDLMCER